MFGINVVIVLIFAVNVSLGVCECLWDIFVLVGYVNFKCITYGYCIDTFKFLFFLELYTIFTLFLFFILVYNEVTNNTVPYFMR